MLIAYLAKKLTFARAGPNTMRLNPDYQRRIQGKGVVVMDGFTTQGYSGECARHMLLEAGAAEVVCINVSKYGRDYWPISRTGARPCATPDPTP